MKMTSCLHRRHSPVVLLTLAVFNTQALENLGIDDASICTSIIQCNFVTDSISILVKFKSYYVKGLSRHFQSSSCLLHQECTFRDTAAFWFHAFAENMTLRNNKGHLTLFASIVQE